MNFSSLLRCLLLAAFVINGNTGHAQSGLATLINSQKERGIQFHKRQVLQADASAKPHLALLRAYQPLRLDHEALRQLYNSHDAAIEFSFPFKNKTITLELVEVNLLTPDFKVQTDAGVEPFDYVPGHYYRGIIKGDQDSYAAFSFFGDECSGIVSSSVDGNINVGKQANSLRGHEPYLAYADADILQRKQTKCSTPDDTGYAAQLAANIQSGASLRESKCVRLYYEVDHDIYEQCGNDLTATYNWMTAVANEVAALYDMAGISTSVSGILVWTDPDPYSAQYAPDQLALFEEQRPQYAGDLAQLVSIEPYDLGGVAASIDGFCNQDLGYCYSEVDYEFDSVPTYSWTVDVIAHEFGHLMGSLHTHNCSWPGGPIDDCGPLAGFPNEGNCVWGPDPVNGGTIMSYCQLTSFGVNFANGFGPLPSQAMAGAVATAICLTTDCAPIVPYYCESEGNTQSEWIQTTKFNGDINNSGPGGGYSDFTDSLQYFPPSSTVLFTLSPGYSGTHWLEYFSIWIDYNNDKDFFDSGENVYQSGETNVPVSGSFQIPASSIGSVRMRVSMMFDTLPGPCGDFMYGEVEDYTVVFAQPVSYCLSSGNNANEEWIDYVQLGSLVRSSGSDGGYYDGTAQVAQVFTGADNYITYSGDDNGTNHHEYWKLWIDYNHDGDFDDADEKVFGRNSSSNKYLVRKFTLPAEALLGTTRMRLQMERGQSPEACDVFDYGEVEDYSVNILSQLPSEGKDQATPAFSVYPNPASSQLNIKLTMPIAQGWIELYAADGRSITTTALENSDGVVIDLTSLLAGIYFVRLLTPDSDSMVKSFIKE